MTHACPCGERLDDGRATYCDRCRGQRTRAQDVVRHARAENKFRDSIWWLYFRNALRTAIEFHVEQSAGGADEWSVSAAALRKVSRAAGVQKCSLEAAIAGQPVSRQVFRRLCKWMGISPSRFEHRRRDPLNLPKGRAA